MDAIGTAYRQGREAIVELLADRPAGELSAVVPACPSWTVLETVAHLVGVCDDALAGRMDGVTTDPWTEAQVAARRQRGLDELVAEWARVAGPLEELADLEPSSLMAQWVFDLVTHEHDLRAALGVPGGSGTARMRIAVAWIVEAFLAQTELRQFPPLRIEIDGTGFGSDPAGADGPTVLRLTPFDALRSLGGRRSAQQIRELDWCGADPEPFVAAFTYGPFTLPATPLDEPGSDT